jgi:hypothetical protein
MEEEKLDKACKKFSLLSDSKQDYILGILQALVFAKNEHNQSPEEPSTNPAEQTMKCNMEI